jgi:CDP-glucose 4,6-dehydratase
VTNGKMSVLARSYGGRRVFITGHTGFKGAWLAEWLGIMGAQVTGYALDPPTEPSLFAAIDLGARLNHVVADVRDRDRLVAEVQAAQPSVIFHLAAQAIVRRAYAEPRETFETNVMGTINVLEAARACASVRAVVIVTSDKCYQNHETDQAFRETDAIGGRDPYSASKGCAELVTAAYRESFFADGAAVATGPRTGSSRTARAPSPPASRSSSGTRMPCDPGSMSLSPCRGTSGWGP